MTTPSYTFGQTTPARYFIDRAFQRCGFDPTDEASGWRLTSAFQHINLIMAHWLNLNVPLWLIGQGMTQIIPGQNWYTMPGNLIDLLDVTAMTSIPLYGGTAASSAGGDASKAFNGDARSTGCIQTSPNGNISYDYTLTPAQAYPINYVGVQVLGPSPQALTLAIESSLDNVNWVTRVQYPTKTYYPNNNAIENTSLYNIDWLVNVSAESAPYWRIRETGGATMQIAQLYFCVPGQSRVMGELSRSRFMGLPNKYMPSSGGIGIGEYQVNQYSNPWSGNQNSYYLDRLTDPKLFVWQTPMATGPIPIQTTPGVQRNVLFYTYNQKYQDVFDIYDPLNMPSRYFKAFIDVLALELSRDFAKEMSPDLEKQAASSFDAASLEDSESTPISLMPNFIGT